MRPHLTAAARRRLDPEARYGLRLTLLAVAVFLVAVPFGLLLGQVTTGGPLTRVDASLAGRLHDRVADAPALAGFLRVVSFLGSPPWLAAVVGATALHAARRRRWRLSAFLVATTLIGGALNSAVKAAVARERPAFTTPVATAGGASFPSGHAMASTVAYGAVLLVVLPALPRRVRRPAVAATGLLVAAVGVSRLGLGVHYASDVLGGHALGAAWLSASTGAFSVWRVERGREPVAPLEGLEPEAGGDLVP